MDIVTELPDMTDAEWDAYCAKLAAEMKAKTQARKSRKLEVIALLNQGIRPEVKK